MFLLKDIMEINIDESVRFIQAICWEQKESQHNTYLCLVKLSVLSGRKFYILYLLVYIGLTEDLFVILIVVAKPNWHKAVGKNKEIETIDKSEINIGL